jgi:hypothetical protein
MALSCCDQQAKWLATTFGTQVQLGAEATSTIAKSFFG